MGITESVLKLISNRQDSIVVEVGVAQGDSAVKFLELKNVKKYIGIDPWQWYKEPPNREFKDGYLDRKMGLWQTQKEWDEVYNRVMKRLAPFKDRAEILRAFSHEAVDRVEDELDVVYLDGNHQYEYVLNDLNAWYPKLKEGGLLMGDDFSFSGGPIIDEKWGGKRSCRVKGAVEDFCERMNINSYVIDDQFVIHKPYQKLTRYKDIHKGKRVFLIGNGPSLKKTDLDLIKDEYAIAMNRISLIYPETAWRPTYYLYTADNINNKNWGDEWQKSVNEAVSVPSTTSFVWRLFADRVTDNHNIVWVDNVTEWDIAKEGTFSTNAAQWISKTGTSMNVAFQLAYFMGFDEIIVLGCDLNWKTTTGLQEDPNHFDPNYSARIPDGERERLRMRKTHEYAYSFFKAAGREVYNATIDTLLDIYPLVDYEAIARNKEWHGSGKDEGGIKILFKRLKMWWYWKFSNKAISTS